MSSKLQKSLTDYNSTLVKEGEILYGNLGTTIGGKILVSVPGRAGYVYVRLRTKLSELIEAFNSEVAQKYNTPVLVERKGNRYVVIGRNTETFSDWETNDPYIPQHAEQHIFDKDGGNMGGDPVWVYPYQFMPSLVTPFGSRGAANVFLHSYPLHTENGWKYTGNTGTPRLTQYNPESGATLVLVTLDSQTGNPAIFATTGTFIPESVTGTSQLISYLPQVSDLRYLPDSFIRLVSGTSSIGWSNIYDVRQFLSFSPSGTSYLSINGNSGIDDFEFTGALVSVTGTTAYISITGSSGGVSDHEALTGLLGGSANDHWHLTPSQMIGLVSGTSTALHSHAGGIGTGTAGQLVKWGALGNTLVDAALIPPATNILTLTATAASTLGLAISAGKTITLTATDNSSITFTGASNLTIPTAGAVVAALLGTANLFITQQMVDGTSDQIQLRVQGHSTQTTKLQTWETSAGVVTTDIDNTGLLSFTSAANSTFISMFGNRNSGNTEVGINFRDRNAVAGGQLAARINSIRESTGALFSLQFHTGGPVAGADATLKATLTSAGSLLIGSATDTARLFVVGATDKQQFQVRANATQTATLASIVNSAGTGIYFQVAGNGLLSSYVTITDPTHAAQTNHYYIETVETITGADAAGVDVNALKTAAFFNGGANSGGSVTGIRGTAYNQSANSLTDLYGLTFRSGVTNASATVINAYGIDVGIFSTAAGAITNAYGANIPTPLGAATITNLYGLYIGSQSTGATLNYAIYTNLGLNRFGDQIEIIGAVDRNQLKVTGFTTQTLPVGYIIDNTSATNVIRNVLQLETQSTGTAANGLGAGLLFSIETATASTMQSAAQIAALWTDATNATRKAKLQLSAYDTAQRVGLEIEASGSAAMIGLYGVTPIIRPTTASAAATFSQLSGNTVNDASTFDGYTLLQVVKALRDIGVLT